MVQYRDEEHKPAAVHILRDVCHVIDGKTLITHTEDQIELFQPHPLVFVQHGDAVEQMPGVDHQGHQKGLQQIKPAQQQIDQHKLHGTGENAHAGDHGDPERKSRRRHQNAVGYAQHQIAGKHWDCMRKCSPQGFCFHKYSLSFNDFPEQRRNGRPPADDADR